MVALTLFARFTSFGDVDGLWTVALSSTNTRPVLSAGGAPRLLQASETEARPPLPADFYSESLLDKVRYTQPYASRILLLGIAVGSLLTFVDKCRGYPDIVGGGGGVSEDTHLFHAHTVKALALHLPRGHSIDPA